MDASNPVPPTNAAETDVVGGSKDGSTAADNDQPYRFGAHLRVDARFPFTERQFARLLILRGRVQDQATDHPQLAA